MRRSRARINITVAYDVKNIIDDVIKKSNLSIGQLFDELIRDKFRNEEKYLEAERRKYVQIVHDLGDKIEKIRQLKQEAIADYEDDTEEILA